MAIRNNFSIDLPCTCAQFFTLLDDYTIDHDYEFRDPYYWVRDITKPGRTHNIIFLWDRKGNHKTLSFMKVMELPENKVLLRVHFSRMEWKKLKVYWLYLYNRLLVLDLVKREIKIIPRILHKEEILLRQKQVKKLFEDHKRIINIVNELHKSESTIKRDLSEMGLSRNWPRIRSRN